VASQNIPQSFPNPPGDLIDFAAGQYHSVALDVHGAVWTFGNNMYGQLGTGTYTSQNIPTRIKIPIVVVKIAAGGSHTLILSNDGDVYTFGNNFYGQLCNGNQGGSQTTPTRIKNLPPIVALAAGWGHSLLLTADGVVYTCGRNADGELGLGDNVNRLVPTKNTEITVPVVAIACGSKHSLVLTNDKQVLSFGSNAHGQLCRPASNFATPTPIEFSGFPTSVSGGMYHSGFIVIPAGGTVQSKIAVVCGQNLYGQLGTTFKNDIFSPFPISSIYSSVKKVVTGSYHTVILTERGEVFAFGRNYDGQLGNGDFEDSSVLEFIPFPTPPVNVFAGGSVTVFKL